MPELGAAIDRTDTRSHGADKAWLIAVRDRLEAEFRRPPRLHELAAEHGRHPAYVCQEFHRVFGLTIGAYVRAIRFDWAREALRAGTRRLSDIAFAAGFSDQAHFSREVRRRTGMSPQGLAAELRAPGRPAPVGTTPVSEPLKAAPASTPTANLARAAAASGTDRLSSARSSSSKREVRDAEAGLSHPTVHRNRCLHQTSAAVMLPDGSGFQQGNRLRAIVSGVLGAEPESAVSAGPYVVRIAQLAPHSRLSSHAHLRTTLNVVLQGYYGEAVGSGDVEMHGPATLIAKPAGAVHRNQVGAEPVECLVLELPDDDVGAVAGVFQQPLAQRSACVGLCAARLRVELLQADDLRPLLIEALVEELLAEAADIPASPGERRWLVHVRDLLHEEPGVRSLRKVAEQVGRHPNYVARAFRARFGCSVGDYARALRVERARGLIHDTTWSLSEIAAQCGYSDQSHLTRDFRRTFKRTPAGYRRLVRRR